MKKHLLSLICFGMLSVSVFAQGNLDTINFDKPSPLVKIDTTKGNIWQIGKPQKIFFDSAYSGPNAIVTDTMGYYPKNTVSSFTVTAPAPPSWRTWDICTMPTISFWEKHQTDTLKDTGTVSISADMGKTWYRLDHYTVYAQGMPYKTISGNSKTWQWVFWGGDPVGSTPPFPTCDTALFRFTFYSDSINTNKEGWMIDDIIIGWDECEGINEVSSAKNTISLYPNPASTSITVAYHLSQKHGVLNLYNPLGQLVKSEALTSMQNTVEENISQLSNGIYYYTLSVDGIVQTTSKLVVIH